ncbi:MAG: peptidylprolyl isomerase [Nitrospirota bacterium]
MSFLRQKKGLPACLAGLLTLVILSQGCIRSNDLGNGVLATVDNNQITVEDYKIVTGQAPPKLEDRESVLWRMIDTKILAREAASKGMLGATQVRWGLEAFYDESLPDLLRRDVYNKTVIDQNEIDAVKKQADLKTVIHVMMIITPTMDDAQSAISEIQKGAGFQDVAKKYSMFKEDVSRDISLDNSLYPVGVRAVLNRMKPGELTPAMKTDIGYTVMRVQSKDDPEELWKRREKEVLDGLKKQKLDGEMAELLDKLRTKAKIKVYSQKNSDGETIYTGADVDGMKVTMDPRLFEKQKEGYHFPHEMMNARTLKDALNGKINDILYAEEARARGLQNDPEFQKELKMKTEQVLAEYYLEQMTGGNEASQKDINDSYEKYKKEYGQRTLADVSHIVLPTEDQAKAALAELKSGKDFGQLAKEKSIDQSSRKDGGEVGFIDPEELREPMKSTLLKMKAGEISGVIKGPLGYEIVRVTKNKTDTAPPLSEVEDKMKQRVLLVKRSDRVEALYKSLHEKYRIKINEQLLKSL